MLESIRVAARISDKVEVVSASVDAFSAIWRGEKKSGYAMEVIKYLDGLFVNTSVRSLPYHVHGYRGLVNSHYYWGQKGNDTLLGATGAVASVVEEKSRGFFPSVTRIDLEATVLLPEVDDGWVKRIWKDYRHREERMKVVRSPSKFVSSDSGDTLYIGRRGAQKMLRLYDKGGQQGDLKGEVIRYEVEYREEMAENVAFGIARRDTSIEDFILRQVFTAYYQSHIRLPVDYQAKIEVSTPPLRPSGQDRYLEWIRAVVGPAVARASGFSEGQELLRDMGIQTSFLEQVDNGESSS